MNLEPDEISAADQAHTARVIAERRELMRLAAAAAIRRHRVGAEVDPHYLAWARAFVAATPPLAHPLSDGAPA